MGHLRRPWPYLVRAGSLSGETLDDLVVVPLAPQPERSAQLRGVVSPGSGFVMAEWPRGCSRMPRACGVAIPIRRISYGCGR